MQSINDAQRRIQIASTYGQGDAFEKSQPNDLKKGAVGDAFNYGSDPVKFVKTGKEIKDKLPSILADLNNKLVEATSTMSALRVAIGKEPEETSGYSSDIKTYPYQMCSAEGSVTPYGSCTDKESSPSDSNCSKYNNLAYQLYSIQSDIATLSVVENNLKDDQKYSLTTSQLVALHFS